MQQVATLYQWMLLALLIGTGAMGVAIIRSLQRWLQVRQRRRTPEERARATGSQCSQCGYVLAGQEIPRCPECGCAWGFDRSFAQLGIDEKQVRQHRRQRNAQLREPVVNPPDCSG